MAAALPKGQMLSFLGVGLTRSPHALRLTTCDFSSQTSLPVRWKRGISAACSALRRLAVTLFSVHVQHYSDASAILCRGQTMQQQRGSSQTSSSWTGEVCAIFSTFLSAVLLTLHSEDWFWFLWRWILQLKQAVALGNVLLPLMRQLVYRAEAVKDLWQSPR